MRNQERRKEKRRREEVSLSRIVCHTIGRAIGYIIAAALLAFTLAGFIYALKLAARWIMG